MPPSNPGARANPRPSTATDQQIASSNATANAFLGGRQPSWMTSGAPKRKSISRAARPARPAVPRPPVVQAVHQHQQPQPAVLPSPAPSDEPSPALSNGPDSPKANTAPPIDAHNMGPTIGATPATLPVTNARFVHEPLVSQDVQAVQRPSNVCPPPHAESRSPSFGYRFQPLDKGTQDGQNTHTRNMSFDGGPAAAATRSSAPPAKRRRTDQPSSPRIGLSSLLPMLEQYIQSHGGVETLGPSIEKPRMMLLQEACRMGDEFFIVLHQLFSMWTLKLPAVYASLPVSRPTIDNGFTILEGVLKKNELISPPRQLWFSRFPVPHDQFSRGLIGGPAVLMQIAMFLHASVREYESLLNASLQRKYPFLVDELLGRLNCYSPVLQRILFTACRRRLGVPEDHLGSQLEQAFRDDQDKHRNTVTGALLPAPVNHNGEIEQQNASLVGYYRLVVENAAFRAAKHANLRSPPIPNTPVLQQPGFPSLQGAQQQHQAVSITSPISNPIPPIYPSSAPSPSSQAPTATMCSYATPQATIRAGPTEAGSPVTSPQTCQQRLPTSKSPSMQFQAMGNGVPNQQSRMLQPQFVTPQHLVPQLQEQQQLVSQRLNQLQYQHNLQIAGSIPLQLGLHVTAQLPTDSAHASFGAHPAQNMPRQQMQYNTFIQQTQPTMSPSNYSPSRMPSGSAPATPLTAHQIQQEALQRHQESKAEDSLLPPKGSLIARPDWPYDPSDRKSIMMSLHQAHVRSPKRIVRDGETERLYQAVKSLLVGPVPVVPKKTMYEFRFEVTEAQFALAATKRKDPGIILPVVEHFGGALRWRVRCCLVPGSAKTVTEEQWATLDVSWPSYIHMALNTKPLDIRRRAHNGKDLATEVTDFIVCGTNVLMIAVHDSPGEEVRNRHLAVEMLETLGHSTIVKSIWSQGVIPEEKTLDTIRRRLTASADDEVSFEAPYLSIDLADPFSSTIFKVPARGVGCTHMECFDLENWLNTRPAKPPIKCPHKQVKCTCNSSDEPSSPDKWRCPICSKDARPYSLRVDGFLLKVRKQLEEEGKLHAKSMRVDADGAWSVVLEADDEESDGEASPKPTAAVTEKAKAAPAPLAVRKEVEVIELD